jgi:hypothetical protein
LTCFRILLFILCFCILLCIMYHMCILYLIFVKIMNKICLRTLDRFFQIQNLSSIVVYNLHDNIQPTTMMDRRYRDRMVVGFTTTYAISAYQWVRISIRARYTTLCDKVCQWLLTGWWCSPGSPVSSTNKTDLHDITETLLKVALNTIKQTNKHTTMILSCTMT